jgi:hypothetical protein
MRWFVLLVAVGVSVTWNGRIAGERGRSPALWGFLTALVAVIGNLACLAVGLLASARDDSGSTTLFLFSIAFPIGLVLPMVGVALLLKKLPMSLGALSQRSWPMYRMGVREQSSYDCILHIDGDRLRIEAVEAPASVEIPFARTTIVPDGEAICIRWFGPGIGGEEVAMLVPRQGPDSSEWRRAFSESLAARLRARIAAALPPAI